MRIIGIDPGLSITGYGVIEVVGSKLICITYGGIYTKNCETFTEKLLKINYSIDEIVRSFSPDACAVESIFYHQNKKTAITMGHARAAAILAAAKNGLAVTEYSPREVKMSTVGFGAASKVQVQEMIRKIMGLAEIPKPNDASDALAIALCHYHRYKFLKISGVKPKKVVKSND